jgi:hypothetical protein
MTAAHSFPETFTDCKMVSSVPWNCFVMNPNAIHIPILVTRGEKPDLLPEEFLAGMLRRNRNKGWFMVAV